MGTTLIINPSSVISTYCYSIFRVEPSSYCQFSCLYCYARWYRQSDEKLTQQHLREFIKFVKYLKRREISKIPPFRLSTLVEPFQNDDKCLRRSIRILKLCAEYGIPMIVNTKSTQVVKDEIISILQKLNENRLVLVQVSLCTLNEEVSKKLEPNAPRPEDRLKIIEKLASEGIPVAVRYQPLIPSIVEKEYESLVQQIKAAGAVHIIVESLRVDAATLKTLCNILPELRNIRWVSYVESLGSVLLSPPRDWRVTTEQAIRDLCAKYGINFAVCKEDTFYLTTCEDCCGIYMINRDRVIKRITILDLYRIGKIPDSMDMLDRIAKERGFIDLDYINTMPRPVRKVLKWHYKLLLKNINKILKVSRAE